MPDLIAALCQAVETVRAQIPRGELTRASIERLLEAADAVCAEARRSSSTAARTPPAVARRRQEAREKWAMIARENAKGG